MIHPIGCACWCTPEGQRDLDEDDVPPEEWEAREPKPRELRAAQRERASSTDDPVTKRFILLEID